MKPHKNATFSLPQSRFARQLPRQREPELSYFNHLYKPRFVYLQPFFVQLLNKYLVTVFFSYCDYGAAY